MPAPIGLLLVLGIALSPAHAEDQPATAPAEPPASEDAPAPAPAEPPASTGATATPPPPPPATPTAGSSASAVSAPEQPVDRSTSRLGMGVSGGSNVPLSAGLQLSGTAPTAIGKVGFEYSHRMWRAPLAALEDAFIAQGVTEGLPGYWANRMRFAAYYRVQLGEGNLRFGADLGPSLVRARLVAADTQNWLLEEHGLYLGPQWTMGLGPHLRVGLVDRGDWLQVGPVARYHHPIAGRIDDHYNTIELSGRLYDPSEIVDPELEAGMGARVRVFDVVDLELEGVARYTLPSQYEVDQGLDQWSRDLIVDAVIGLGF
jgi:hypothetical protein